MVYYVRNGKVPASRHTFDDRKNLRREELFGEESFEGAYSLLYHLYEPTNSSGYRVVNRNVDKYADAAHIHRHLLTGNSKRGGNILNGRHTILMNDRVKVQILVPSETTNDFYRNADYEMLIFVHEGKGNFISPFGNIDFSTGDYIYVPKGTTFRMDYSEDAYFLILLSKDTLKIPPRYLNNYGQLKEGTPYYTRDIRPPKFNKPEAGNGKFSIHVDFDSYYVVQDFKTSPLDVEGWDGYLYPFAISVHDMAPIVGKLHMPPPIHETMSSRSMMVATFLPRKYDFHERSIPISYYHSNVDVDEFLFYSSGNFMSRKGIKPGSVTLHVRGLTHGPQPGAVEGALGKEGTDELAVMIETYDPLRLTEYGATIDEPEYMKSWSQ